MRTVNKAFLRWAVLALPAAGLLLIACGGTPKESSEPTPTPLPRLSTAQAYLERGLGLMDHKSYDYAIADFTAAIELDAGNVQAYVNRAAIYRVVGRKNEAQADVDRLVELGQDRAAVELLVSLAARRQ